MAADIKVKTNGKNLLNPCPIRDHNADFREILRKHEPEPSDPNAAAALQDENYAKGMDSYDAKYQQLVDTVWDKVFEHNAPLTTEELAALVEPTAIKC